MLNDEKLSINVLFYATYLTNLSRGDNQPFFALVLNELYQNGITDKESLMHSLRETAVFFEDKHINKTFFKPINVEDTQMYVTNKYQLESAKAWFKSQLNDNLTVATEPEIAKKYEDFIKIIDEFSQTLGSMKRHTLGR